MPTESEPVVVVENDCRTVIHCADLSGVVAVITGPPYGVGLTMHKGRTGDRLDERYETIRGDEDGKAGRAVLEWAASQGLPTVAFADPQRPWPGEWRQHLVWDKGEAVGGLGDYARTWKRTWELIQVARNGPLLGKRDGAVLRFPVTPGEKAHPAEKPVELMRYLIRQLVPPGGYIFDPFCGSGTTGVACIAEGRRALLVETNREYCDLARRRVAEAMGRGAGSLLAWAEGQ